MKCLQQVVCLQVSDNCARGKQQQMQEQGWLSIAYAFHMVLMGDSNIVHVHSHRTGCKSPNNKLACHSQAHDITALRRDRTAVCAVKVTAPVHAPTSVSVLQFHGLLTLALRDAFQCQGCLLANGSTNATALVSDHNNGHPQRRTCCT